MLSPAVSLAPPRGSSCLATHPQPPGCSGQPGARLCPCCFQTQPRLHNSARAAHPHTDTCARTRPAQTHLAHADTHADTHTLHMQTPCTHTQTHILHTDTHTLHTDTPHTHTRPHTATQAPHTGRQARALPRHRHRARHTHTPTRAPVLTSTWTHCAAQPGGSPSLAQSAAPCRPPHPLPQAFLPASACPSVCAWRRCRGPARLDSPGLSRATSPGPGSELQPASATAASWGPAMSWGAAAPGERAPPVRAFGGGCG